MHPHFALTDPMTGTDKPPVFTVASVLAQLMSRSTMTDDTQYWSPPPRVRESAKGPSLRTDKRANGTHAKDEFA